MKKAFINGKCHILNEERTIASAIAVEDDKVLAYGTDEEILALVGDGEVTDLGGKTLLPGFNDSHMHLLNYGYYKTIVDLEGCSSHDEFKKRIKDFIEEKKVPAGHWVEAVGWNQDNWEDTTIPDRLELDEISTEHPIYALRICGHVCCLNTKALEEVGIDRNLPQPKDGYYEVDENGDPTGIVSEMMTFIYNRMQEAEVSDIKEMLKRACADANRVGLTSVQTDDFDALPGRNITKIIKAYRELIDEGQLNLRVAEQCALTDMERYDEFESLGFRIGEGDKFFKLGSLKLYLDGSLGARTAWMLDDYSDDPGNKGFGVYSDKNDLFRLVERVTAGGGEALMHCIGDAATQQGIEAIEYAASKHPDKQPRHGIVHAQILNRDLCERMAKEKIMAYIQPIFIEYDLHMAEDRVGPERIKTSYNWRDMKDMGIMLSMGTDCPVESFNPLANIYSAVTRKDLDGLPEEGWYKEQALTLDEAIEGYTKVSAYMSRDEEIKGTLEKGMLADMVVLNEDIYSIEPDKIKDITVAMTIVGGDIKYKCE